MKKVLCVVVLCVFVLGACAPKQAVQNIEPQASHVQQEIIAAPTASATAVAEQAKEPIPEPEKDNGIPKLINGFQFIIDASLLSDPPEGMLTVFDAVELLSFQDDPLMHGDWGKSDYAYKYNGIIDVGGEECYEIFLLLKDASGEFGENTEASRYAVEVSGKAYVFLEESGEFSVIHNGVARAVDPEGEWWGEYKAENALLYISNYDGTKFLFTIMMEDGSEFSGAAPVEDYTAEYMDMRFTLAGDAVVVEQYEKRADSADREKFIGQYIRE